MIEHTDPDVPDADVAETLRRSNPHATGPDGLQGGMGSSSERVGHVGPGPHSTDGLRDTSPVEPGPDAPPEQSVGGVEANPDEVERRRST